MPELDPVDQLLDLIVVDGHGNWPPVTERRVLELVHRRRAFLETDRRALAIIAGFAPDRPYKVDPLPELIADAWADHLHGDDARIIAANKSDAAPLEYMLEDAGFTGACHEAERRVVGLGEEWWRVYIDLEIADVPLLEFHSRDQVIPLWLAGRLMAVALVTQLDPIRNRAGKLQKATVWRHLEIHVTGKIEHVLFRGSKSRIGSIVPLETHPDLEDLATTLGAHNGQGQTWEHGLPMLMGVIDNGRGVDRRHHLGVSDFDRIEDALLELNETLTTGAANRRLTAKQRMVVPEDALTPQIGTQPLDLIDIGDGSFVPVRPRAQFDAGEDVLVVSRLDSELGRGASDVGYTVLEYTFDAVALIAWQDNVVKTALTRIGLVPQIVGTSTDHTGRALSGTALRLQLIPTTKAGAGKARPWDRQQPHILNLMALLDALPVAQGGCGHSWADPATAPTVERPDALPNDAVEDATVEAALVAAGVRSKRTSIKTQHPEWSDDQVAEELQAIVDDQPATPQFPPPPGAA